MSQTVAICSPVDCGSGDRRVSSRFAYGPEFPGEQTPDDRKSACFDGAPLAAPLDIVGAPQLTVRLSSDKPMAQLAVRLCDLRPDGTSALITMGVLNFTHRNSSEAPELLTPGESFETAVTLDQIAYRIPAGHRMRVAISTSYWPFIWPSPERATVSLQAGALDLPVRSTLADGTNAALKNRLVPSPGGMRISGRPNRCGAAKPIRRQAWCGR
jgi:putative CocE/NonD family hydrolase